MFLTLTQCFIYLFEKKKGGVGGSYVLKHSLGKFVGLVNQSFAESPNCSSLELICPYICQLPAKPCENPSGI